MTPDTITIIVLSMLSASLAVNLWQMWGRLQDERQAHWETKESYDRVLDNAARADERAADVAKIHQELLARPVQTLISREAVEAIGGMLVQYLDAQNSQPIIFPKKDKLQ